MKSTIELSETNFDQEVLQSKLPVVVDFWAEWCGPCKMIAPALEEIARDLQGRAVVAKVNVEEQPLLAERFNIQSIPTLLYFDSGELRDEMVGAVSKQKILTKLAALRTESTDTQPA